MRPERRSPRVRLEPVAGRRGSKRALRTAVNRVEAVVVGTGVGARAAAYGVGRTIRGFDVVIAGASPEPVAARTAEQVVAGPIAKERVVLSGPLEIVNVAGQIEASRITGRAPRVDVAGCTRREIRHHAPDRELGP